MIDNKRTPLEILPRVEKDIAHRYGLTEIDEIDPWCENTALHLARVLESYNPPMNAPLPSHMKDDQRVVVCPICGATHARVTGVLVTQIYCRFCGGYLYKTSSASPWRAFQRELRDDTTVYVEIDYIAIANSKIILPEVEKVDDETKNKLKELGI